MQTQNTQLDQIVSDLDKQPLVVSGGRGSGKSMLTKCIVKRLLEMGVYVKVFDASLSWFNSAPDGLKRISICEDSEYMPNYNNVIYDTFRLSQQDRLNFLTAIVSQDMNFRMNEKKMGESELDKNPWIIYILEESNLTLSTYSLSAVNDKTGILNDMISISRNFRINYITVTTRLAELSTKTKERSNLLLSKTSGLNDLKSVAGSTDKTIAQKVKGFKPYQFTYFNGEYNGVFQSELTRFNKPLDAYIPPIYEPRSRLSLSTKIKVGLGLAFIIWLLSVIF